MSFLWKLCSKRVIGLATLAAKNVVPESGSPRLLDGGLLFALSLASFLGSNYELLPRLPYHERADITGPNVAYRIMLSLVLYHLFMAASSFSMSKKQDAQDRWHEGNFKNKAFGICALAGVLYLLPYRILSLNSQFLMLLWSFLALCFMLFQIISIILTTEKVFSFFCALAENHEKLTPFGFIAICLIPFLASHIYLRKYVRSTLNPECVTHWHVWNTIFWLNIFFVIGFILVNIATSQMAGKALFEVMLGLYGIDTDYCSRDTYLAIPNPVDWFFLTTYNLISIFFGIYSSQGDRCNPWNHSEDNELIATLVSALISLALTVYSAQSVAQLYKRQEDTLDDDHSSEEVDKKREDRPAGQTSVGFARSGTSADVEQATPTSIESEALGHKPPRRTEYSIPFYHLIFACAATFIAFTLTNFRFVDRHRVLRSLPYFGVPLKYAYCMACFVIYFHLFLFPVFMKDSDPNTRYKIGCLLLFPLFLVVVLVVSASVGTPVIPAQLSA